MMKYQNSEIGKRVLTEGLDHRYKEYFVIQSKYRTKL